MPWTKISACENEPPFLLDAPPSAGRIIPYVEAVREAVAGALDIDPSVFVMGQGVDDPAGMFGVTRDLHLAFGPARVFDTPLSENGLMGIAVGAALGGSRPLYFHNRTDFLLLAMDQLVNHAAKYHYMFGGALTVPLVVWACIGRGWGSAAQHSQALHALLMHTPGLKVVMPATAYDAKGLMASAIADNNPVVMIEHRFNFKHNGIVPAELYTVPIGKAAVRRKGSDITIVAVSYMVTEAFRAAERLSATGIEAEIIDVRTIKPLDEETILSSIAKTGRCIIADLGWKTGGVAAKIAALVAEKGFYCLKTPVRRVTSPDLPTPAGYTLEETFYTGKKEIEEAVYAAMK